MSDAYRGWAIVELMGHRRRAGEVREVEQFGARLLRIDIPTKDGVGVTEFYGGGAIYALRPCDEDLARRTADYIGDPRPVAPSTLRLASPPPGDDDPNDHGLDGLDRDYAEPVF